MTCQVIPGSLRLPVTTTRAVALSLGLLAGAVSAVVAAGADRADENRFQNPPVEYRPQVWWHWMNGNVTQQGIAKDLQWMKQAGIGGLHYFDIGMGGAAVVDSPLVYRSAPWREAVSFAVREASRHGLAMTIASSPGFSMTGGPWVEPQNAMKKLVWSETLLQDGDQTPVQLALPPSVTGPFQALPQPPSIAELTAMASGQPLDVIRRDTASHYADTVVLAMPADDADSLAPTAITAGEGTPLDPTKLMDGDFATALDIPRGSESDPGVIVIRYAAPLTIRSAEIFAPGSAMMFAAADILPVLEAMREGEWQKVAELPLDKVPTTVSFAPVTGQEFRIVLTPFKDDSELPSSWEGATGAIGFGFPDNKPETISIAELHLSAEPRIHRFEQKAGFSVASDYYALDGHLSAPEAGIAPSSIVDVTSYLQADGTLAWTPPPGSWRILRFGYSLVGTENHPASAEAAGLEVDKYDGNAVAQYLEDYLAIFRDATGGMVGEEGIGAILTDSIEAGAANWTPQMVEHFERLRGYDPRPWLPALAGVLVGSRAQSDAFLYDFRRTLADLLAEQHYGTVADFAHQQGLKVYGEALEDGRPSLGDDMAMRAHADYPMAAYWAHPRDRASRATYIGDMKGAASVGHLYGRNVVAAESLTSAGFPWALAPVDLKPLIDIQFAHGINRPVIHSSVHQPVDSYLPGISMLSIGQFFNRHVTWADMARPWMDYMARSSYMLQQGRHVADVLYFHGEEAPLTALFAGNRLQDLPTVFAYDFANADVILNQLSVEDGELVAASGARYQALYLGGTSDRMTGRVLEKLIELVEQGAVIAGAVPEISPSLEDNPQCFADLSATLAGYQQQGAARGRFIHSSDIDSALLALGVTPDFAFSVDSVGDESFNHDSLTEPLINVIPAKAGIHNSLISLDLRLRGGDEAGIDQKFLTHDSPLNDSFTKSASDVQPLFLHRRLNDGDIYFVVNRRNETVRGEARFRVTGRVPEIWRADSGAIAPVSYRFDGDHTAIPLEILPEDAFFVVFGKPAHAEELAVPTVDEEIVTELAGPWTVTFQADRGAPEAVIFPTLASLSKHDNPGIRYFSGSSSYNNIFVLPSSIDSEAHIFLDLGEVGDLAEVSVNGEVAGIAWKRPYRVDVSGMLRGGENTLEIRVANLWANRLIGDAQPDAEKVTTIQLPTYRPDAPLRASGLMGPVRLGIKQRPPSG